MRGMTVESLLRLLIGLAVLLGSQPTLAQSSATTDSLRVLIEHDRVDDARRLAEDAAQSFRKTLASKPLDLAERLEELMQPFLDAYLDAEGLLYYREVLTLRRSELGEDQLDVAQAHNLVSWSEHAVGNLVAARDHMLKAAEIRARHLPQGDESIADTYDDLGFIQRKLSDFQGAAESWEATLLHREHAEVLDMVNIVKCLGNLAEMYRHLGEYDRSEDYQLRSIRVSRDHLPLNEQHAILLNNLGAAYKDQGRFDEAERTYQEALRISLADSAASETRLATAYHNLGVLYRDQAKSVQAEGLLMRALEQARPVMKDNPDFTYFLREPAVLLAGLGRWREAISLWEEALAFLDAQDLPHDLYRAEVLHELGKAHLRRGDAIQATEILRESFEIRKRVRRADHPEIGVSLTALAEAKMTVQEDVSDAMPLLKEALAILDASVTYVDTRARAHSLRGRLAWRAGDVAEARSQMMTSLELVEQLRPQRGGGDLARAQFLQDFSTYYNDLIGLLIESRELDTALQYAERIRARVLNDRLLAGRVDLRSGIPSEVLKPLLVRERNARRTLSGLQRRIMTVKTVGDGNIASLNELESALDGAIRDLQDVVDEIRLMSPAWRELLESSGAEFDVDLARQVLLEPSELLLLYQLGHERSFVFVVAAHPKPTTCHELEVSSQAATVLGVEPGPLRSQDLAAILTGGPGSLSSSATDMSLFRGLLLSSTDQPSDTASHGSTAQRLFELKSLLVPTAVWTAVEKASEVIIVPDGDLHRIPFESLVTSLASQRTRYWLDDGPAIRYAHSMMSLHKLNQSEQRGASPIELLTVSNSSFDPQRISTGVEQTSPLLTQRLGSRAGLSPLPGAAVESAAIQAAFEGRVVVALRDSDAQEGPFRALLPKAKYIHVATHGLVDETRSHLLASLVLAPTPGDAPDADQHDGLLHLFEIYDLDLACELAVLSACETSAGAQVQGEGVFALSRGFLSAGARRTVASLWPVSDDSTARLMQGFFQRIAQRSDENEPLSYATLLRDAKRAIRSDPRWSAPFYWAPFVLAGLR